MNSPCCFFTYNLFNYSEQFDNVAWSKAASTVEANSTTSPSGVINADKHIPNTTNAYHPISQGRAVTSGVSYSFSIYVKSAGYNFLLINTASGSSSGNVGPLFDLSNGTLVGSLGGNNYNANITFVGNAWYRIDFSYITNSVTTKIDINPLPTSTVVSYNGNGTSGIYLWGAQLVEGTNALPYQKTETRLNIPRLDYSLGGCPSLLVEPQRTNTVLNSNNAFINGVNGSSSTTTIPSIISGVNYRKMTATAVDGFIYCPAVYLSSSPTGLMCFSIFLKKGTCDDVQLIDQNATGKSIRVNLSNGSIISQSAGLVCGVQSYSDNVYRIFIVQDYTSIGFRYDLYAKQVGDFYYIGAQFESGSYPTSYIPTTSASVTRNQDVCLKTGISSLIGQTEGVLNVKFVFNKIDGNKYITLRRNTATDERIYIAVIGSNLLVGSHVNGSIIFMSGSHALTEGVTYNVAFAYKLNDYACYVNGVSVYTNTSAIAPTFMDALYLAANIAGPYYFTYPIHFINLFPTRLDNATLAALTTI